MGWKARRNGRMYYYRSVRTGTGVRSEYVGTGALAELIAYNTQELSQVVQVARQQWTQDVARNNAFGRTVACWLRAVHRYIDMTIRMWGYHQHKRQWRLARGRNDAMKTADFEPAQHVTHERVMELVLADKLTADQQRELEIGLRAHPSIVANLGDMGAVVRQQLILGMSGRPGMGIVWFARTKTLRKELGFDEATPAEQLVIDTIVTCWLHLQWTTFAYQTFAQQGGTPVQVAVWENRLSAVQNRFARQVELLSRLRYLGSRVQQINIAQHMVVSNT